MLLDLLTGPLRFGVGFGLFAVFLAAEAAQAPRGRPRRRAARWPLNAVLFLLGAGAGRLLAAVGPVGVALWVAQANFGVLHLLAAPTWLAWIAAILALDLGLYWQHRLMHEVGFLWRLHRVHHTDPTLDVTSAYRFHPAEIALSLLWKSAIVAALGAPPEAVAVYEIWLAAGAVFTHADIRLPRGLEAGLRLLAATPGVHEVHHDVRLAGQQSNYSGTLTIWDRLFGTWRTPPLAGTPQLGVAEVDAGLAADIARGLLDPLAPAQLTPSEAARPAGRHRPPSVSGGA